MKFLLEIITPVRQAFSEEVDMVVAPTTSGVVGVLAHHEPLFTSLTEGEIKVTTAGRDFFLAIGGGYMEIAKDKVTVLVSRAVDADELNEVEIKKAQIAAQQAIANKVKGAELMAAQAMLKRSFIELKVFRHRRPQRGLS